MELGRMLIGAGLVLVCLGFLVIVSGRWNLPFGRLPGDFVWRNGNSTIYVPIVTCLILSVLGSLLMWALNRR